MRRTAARSGRQVLPPVRRGGSARRQVQEHGHRGERTDPIRNYPLWRHLWESAQRVVAPTLSPARVIEWLGVSGEVAVDHHDVHVAGPFGGADTLRIAFASDFHAGPMTPPRLIDEAIAHLARADADLLLLGGDFVSLRAEYGRELVRRLAAVPARLGRYGVLGNHDYWADGPEIVRSLQRAGIEVLTNRHVRLPQPFANVSICGLDDHTSGEPDADAAFSGSAPVRVVLMHAPSGLLDIGDRPFAVALCGHTHGGQVALPNGRPLIVSHGPLSRRYHAGRFALGEGRTLLVSRGVGCSAVPVRLNAPPAVLTCTLHAGRASGSG